MSVLKSNRGVSDVQFLETARELEIYTIKQCVKFPKRYTFFITTEIVRLAQAVYNNVKAANSIYPTNAHEAQMRRDCFTRANNDLQCLISQLGIAKELFVHETPSKVWQTWMDLIEKEAKLISGAKSKDKERFIFQ